MYFSLFTKFLQLENFLSERIRLRSRSRMIARSQHPVGMHNLKRRRARVPTYATCKIFKIHTGVFTGTGEPVCRNVAGVYYILDMSLPAYPTGRESPRQR